MYTKGPLIRSIIYQHHRPHRLRIIPPEAYNHRTLKPTADLSGAVFAARGAAVVVERYVAREGFGAEALLQETRDDV